MSDNLPTKSERPLRVLIVRIGAMGDVLHAMPAVTALRERHPDWFIGWAIEPRWGELLQSAGGLNSGPRMERSDTRPLVDAWHQVPTKRWGKRPLAMSTLSEILAMRRELQGMEYDLCVDMQGSIKSAVVGRMAGAKLFAGPAEPREKQAGWLYHRRVSATAAHVIEQGCEILGGAVGETLRPAKVMLPVDKAAERWCDDLMGQILAHGERFVLLAPSAGWGAKVWPAERYGAVAAELARAGFRTLINASSPQNELGRQVVEASGGAAVLLPSSLSEMIALVRRAALVIGGDTGPLHLAAALERPVLGLYGPTDPARNGPYGTRSTVLRHQSSRKDHTRRDETETGLLKITVAEVVEAATNLLHGEAGEQDKVKE